MNLTRRKREVMKIAKSTIISKERFQTSGDADMQEKLVPL